MKIISNKEFNPYEVIRKVLDVIKVLIGIAVSILSLIDPVLGK
jgi:hypothetical protein